MDSEAVPGSNLFHWLTVYSLSAIIPKVMVPHPEATPSCTADVTSNASLPGPLQPAPQSLRLFPSA